MIAKGSFTAALRPGRLGNAKDLLSQWRFGRSDKGGKQCVTILAIVGVDGEYPRAVDSTPQHSVYRESLS
jgi:hypothetical protein